ncbi:MAG TPA: uroporphyrinogen decarboxylase family protein [Anaerolineaceae bacterium]
MNQRERFFAWMDFQKVDRMPLMEMGFWDETFSRWHAEGLPKWVTHDRHIEAYLGLDLSFNRNWLPINTLLYPAPEVRVIAETENEQILTDDRLVTLRQQKRFKTIPQYIRFPVVDEASYEALLPLLDGSAPGRYPEDFDNDLHWRWERGEIVGVNFHSFFGFIRDFMGLENTCLAYYDQPALVRRMIADRLTFARQVLARVLATGKLQFVQVWEDMAYKAGPLISPRLVREFMLPAYVELVQFLRENGVRLIMVDCDGRVDKLLPIWLEAGIDGVHPCEIAAGSDPLALRRAFPGVRLMGGLDKRRFAEGKSGVDAELGRIVPLLKEGGFIPFVDHFVPPDISYETFCYSVEERRKYL